MSRASLEALVLLALLTAVASAADLSPIRSFPIAGNNLHGLAYGSGHLWVTDLDSNIIFDVDPGTGAVFGTRPDLTDATGLAHDGVNLLTTRDAGTAECGGPNPNRIYRVNPADGAVLSSIPSPITGGGGGLGVMPGDRLFAVGAYDQCPGVHVEVVEVDPATGSVLGHFNVDPYGIGNTRELDCDATAVLYLTAVSDYPDSPPEFRLHRFTPSGTLLRLDRLILPAGTLDGALTGLAWGDEEIFVADRWAQRVWVFSYNPPPTPTRAASWGLIKSLYP